jgi:hypothetical protein
MTRWLDGSLTGTRSVIDKEPSPGEMPAAWASVPE